MKRRPADGPQVQEAAGSRGPDDADKNAQEVKVNLTDMTNTTPTNGTVTVTNVDETSAAGLSPLKPESDMILTAASRT